MAKSAVIPSKAQRGKGGRGIPKGANLTVQPIRFPRQIMLIKQNLVNRPRDLCMFVMGINNGLRLKDLLRLRVGQVRYLQPGEHITIREGKTGKLNVLVVNKPVYKALRAYLACANLADSDYLFLAERTRRPLTSILAGRMVKQWCEAIGLVGNYGAHTLRKTWAYTMRKRFSVSWELIGTRLNHSSPSVTKRYLGITTEEVIELLQNPVG